MRLNCGDNIKRLVSILIEWTSQLVNGRTGPMCGRLLSLQGPLATQGKALQERKAFRPGACIDKVCEAVGNMGEKFLTTTFHPQKSISAEGLHQTLYRGRPKEVLEFRPVKAGRRQTIIISQ